MDVSKDVGVIDLFCGIGGLSHGFYKERFDVLAGVDLDKSCKFPFEYNNNSIFIHKSVEELAGKNLRKVFGDKKIKILVGCAPCQPFSTYNLRKKEDKDWKLLRDFSRLVSEVRPDIISMENVPQIRHHKIFWEFVKNLEKKKYHVSYYIVFGPNFGIPQKRKRLVLFASKFGKIDLIENTHDSENYKTVKDAIGSLPKIKDGETSSIDPLHKSSKLSRLNKVRIMKTREGGGWQDWNDELKLKCHRRKTGKSFGSVYGRMKWNEPSPTITTEFRNLGSGRFGHPEQNRALSVREAALLQTFPRKYKFFKKKSDLSYKSVSRHIGNAVPVRLGVIIARSIKYHIKSANLEENNHV